MILAIDTATTFAALALVERGELLLAEVGQDPRSHAEELGPMLQRAIGDRTHLVSAIVVGRGPGSFTGLRVGIVAARTIGWALGVPVIGVCTLDAIAVAADPEFTGFVVTDARRMELFHAQYLAGDRVTGPAVATRTQVRELIGAGEVTGDISLLSATERKARGDTHVQPGALGVVAAKAIAAGSEVSSAPEYLRSPDISGGG